MSAATAPTVSTTDAATTAAPTAPSSSRPPIFEIELTVSSGTYIRSIVHDIGLALGSAAHVVKLTRTRQGEFVLEPPAATTTLEATDSAAAPSGDAPTEQPVEDAPKATADAPAAESEKKLELETFSGGCVEWTLLEKAIAEQAAAKKEGREVTEGRDEDGWLEWERDLLSKCKEV